jgi:hypothetical protein
MEGNRSMIPRHKTLGGGCTWSISLRIHYHGTHVSLTFSWPEVNRWEGADFDISVDGAAD